MKPKATEQDLGQSSQPSGPLPGSAGGERRQLTAFFYDIVDSTGLLNRLDPEDFGFLERQIHAAASAAITENGGYFYQVQGDGGCAYFGYPVPAEDAAECAVAAGLAFVEGCRRLALADKDLDQQVEVRVGIATGMVVIGDLEPDRLSQERRFTGLTPNLASRAQGFADPNTVAVADTTYRLTRHAFDYQPLGSISLKGFSEPQRLWRVTAKRALQDRFTGARQGDTPLVARINELEACRRCWKQAAEGRGQAVLIHGDPGIGKSRLVLEMRRELVETDCDIRVFQCQPRGNNRPLHPFLDRLRADVRRASPQSEVPSETIIEHLKSVSPGVTPQALDVISFMLANGIDLEIDYPEVAVLAPDEIRRRAEQASLEVIASWARVRPQMIILEDLHWADSVTLGFVARTIQEMSSLPIMLIVTMRDPPTADLTHGEHVLSLALKRLDVSAVAALVGAMFHSDDVPAGMAAFIADRSDGVPLFVEELAAFLRERLGSSQQGPVAWERLLRDGSITTLQDLCAARLARLGEARKLAQLASVIGRDFSYDLLTKLIEGEELSGSLADHLKVLLDSGIISRKSEAVRREYRFRHAMIEEAAYSSLLKSQRRRLHARILALEKEGSLELPDDAMAWHCEQAGRMLEAGRYAIAAADAYAVRSATREAERLLAAAEGYLASCAAGPQLDELRLQLLATRGPVATSLLGKGSPEARAIYDEGVALCQQVAPHDRERWFPIYWGWWFTSPDQGTKRMRSEVIVRDLDKASDPEVRLQALHCMWAASFHAGEHAECLQSIGDGLALYDPERARLSRVKYAGHDAKVCALGERALLVGLTGDTNAADQNIAAAIAWAGEIEHLGSVCHALDCAIVLAYYQGDAHRVDLLARQMRELADANELSAWKHKSAIFAGWARAKMREASDGLIELEQAMGLQAAIGSDEDLPVYRQMHAELLQLTGNSEGATAVLDIAIQSAQRTANLVWMPELLRMRAQCRLASDSNLDLARADLERSAALAERQGAAAFLARARADLGRLTNRSPLE